VLVECALLLSICFGRDNYFGVFAVDLNEQRICIESFVG
jgi:hypothetical protein